MVAAGTAPNDIFSSPGWVCFHFFGEIEPVLRAAPPGETDALFDNWLRQREENARYVLSKQDSIPGRKVAGKSRCDALPFWPRTLYLLRRDP